MSVSSYCPAFFVLFKGFVSVWPFCHSALNFDLNYIVCIFFFFAHFSVIYATINSSHPRTRRTCLWWWTSYWVETFATTYSRRGCSTSYASSCTSPRSPWRSTTFAHATLFTGIRLFYLSVLRLWNHINFIPWTYNSVYFVVRTIHEFMIPTKYFFTSVIHVFCIIWNPRIQVSMNMNRPSSSNHNIKLPWN